MEFGWFSLWLQWRRGRRTSLCIAYCIAPKSLHSQTLGAGSDAIKGGQMQGAQIWYLLRNSLTNVIVVLLILPLDSL